MRFGLGVASPVVSGPLSDDLPDVLEWLRHGRLTHRRSLSGVDGGRLLRSAGRRTAGLTGGECRTIRPCIRGGPKDQATYHVRHGPAYERAPAGRLARPGGLQGAAMDIKKKLRRVRKARVRVSLDNWTAIRHGRL